MTRKFLQADQQCVAQRQAFADKYGRPDLWSIIDHWPLYAGVYSISRFLAIARLVEDSLGVPGHIAEVGSWRGANLLFMAKLLRLFDPHCSKEVHAFEGFEGLQEFASADGPAVESKGQYKGRLDELTDLIDLYELNDDVVIHQGLVEDTLPKLLDEMQELSFSLIYLDVDLYKPTLAALELFHERLSVGGLFVLDEWNVARFPGETVAVREFLAARPDHYAMEQVRHTRQPSLVLRRLKF
jgi:hypothetical protein